MRIVSSIRTFLFGLVLLSLSAASFAQLSVSISFAPPELPVYEQPLCPGDGYLWTPGYWAYANDIDDYYWVPGTWVMAPEVGLLWTPAYWGWGGGGYQFHDGYWGSEVGFYGGISYGYGYFGDGYQGGRWQSGHFYYNRSVSNVNVTVIHNVYNTTVVNSMTVNRVSFNGGTGGINARPTAQDEAAAREKHIPPVAAQTQHAQAARANPELRASVNHGKPAIAATPKPGELNDRAAVPAKQAGKPYNPPAKQAAAKPAPNHRLRMLRIMLRTLPSLRRTTGQSRTVRRPRSSGRRSSRPRNSRQLDRNRPSANPQNGRKLLRHASQRSPSALPRLPLERKRGQQHPKQSAHNPRRGRQKNRNGRTSRPKKIRQRNRQRRTRNRSRS